MWPVYALLIWLAGALLVDLIFDCTGDRSLMCWTWPIWLLPVLVILAVAALMNCRFRPTHGEG